MKNNPVKKNMDKFHKPRTHRDKTKYHRKSESEKMQDDLEPIIVGILNDVDFWEDEGGAIHPDSSEEMDYSGAFESDIDLGPKTS